MKSTLLELTQNILSRLDSDEVNSISDTTESRQVAKVIENAYFNILSRADLPKHKKLFSLQASGDDLQPTLMIKPDNVVSIEWIKYNKTDASNPGEAYDYVTIVPLEQFLHMQNQLDTTDTAYVGTLTFNVHTFPFQSDRQPTYCTVVDNNYIMFDSYDSTVDTTLQESKTSCFGLTVPTFDQVDSFIPDLDDNQFPLLLNEATALAFVELKQVSHDKAELEARRQWRTLQRTKSLAKVPSSFDSLPDFGRRGRVGRSYAR